MAKVSQTPSRWLLTAGVLCVLGSACRERGNAIGASHPVKLIVLGIDGMDPNLTRKFIAEGRMPNVQKMIAGGGFIELGTANPPQSPVAWSAFITGLGSDGHGIFDFVHRDAHGMTPYLSTSRPEEPFTITLGPLSLPLGSPEMKLLREGTAFWQELEHHNVPATVLEIPANFPPAETKYNVSTSGMGTPDLLGTYGTFQTIVTGARAEDPFDNGITHAATLGKDNIYRAELEGPPGDDGKAMTLPVEIIVDKKGDKPRSVLRFGEREIFLAEGQWSTWQPIEFPGGLVSDGPNGMIRVFAKQLQPNLLIYISPINLDPLDSMMPLSSPESAAGEMAEKTGRYYTQGMPQDTKALSSGVFSDDEFLVQADSIYRERLVALDEALRSFKGGFLFFYFSSIDQVSHMFWRALEPDASTEDARYANVIPDLYHEMDKTIGKVLASAGDTPVMLMSDHGFASYRNKVHLNTWLADKGYLALAAKRSPGALGHIDWKNTQAYALGLNQLFLNLRGREPDGAIPPDERQVFLDRLKRDLESWVDPDSGERVVTHVEFPKAGRFADRAPDILVGYNRGYRSSDESAMGIVGAIQIERNRSKWSGDHCMDPALVPGVLITSKPLGITAARLSDLAPHILQHFGVQSAKPNGNLFGAGAIMSH